MAGLGGEFCIIVSGWIISASAARAVRKIANGAGIGGTNKDFDNRICISRNFGRILQAEIGSDVIRQPFLVIAAGAIQGQLPLGESVIRARISRAAAWRKPIIEICVIHLQSDAALLHIRNTVRHLRPTLGIRERRQKHRRQNGDDGNDHKKFDQGKAAAILTGNLRLMGCWVLVHLMWL